MLLTHKIQIPIYNADVTFLIGDAYEVQDYLADIKGTINVDFNPNITDGICIHNKLMSWIWLSPDSDISVLIHELSHCVFDIMEDVGLNFSDSEAFCYLIQYLVNECKSIFAIQMDPIKQV